MNPALKTYGYSAVRFARKHASLSAILFVGAFLRIYQLGAESLWYDEVVSVWFAHLRGPSEIFEISRTDPNFPLITCSCTTGLRILETPNMR